VVVERGAEPGSRRSGGATGGHAGTVARGVLLSLATVALVALAFPPFGWWPCILVAFVPMVVAQHRVLPARWSALGPGVGIGGMFAYHLSPGLADGDVSPVVHLWPVFVAALVVALTWRSRAFHERTGYRWFLVSGPVAWVALDFLRASGTEVLAATFGYRSYALYEHPLLLQPVSVFGIHGLELVILLVNWAAAALVIAALDRRSRAAAAGDAVLPPGLARRGAVAVAVVVAAWVAASASMIDRDEPDVVVAAVQTGVARGGDDWEERFRRDVEQTREAAARGAELVVWNEVGLQVDATVERTDELRALVAETGVHLAVGFGFTDEEGRRHNEVLLMAPNGEILGVYGKDHPGTFAGDYSDTGGTYPVYDTELGPIATIICYDLDFTDTARRMADGGARLVATPSADVPAIARTHYTHLVFRAIENRVSMVKADNEFDSAIIDPYGRVLERAVSPDGGLQATLVAAVPLGSGDSPWVRFGDWFGWLTVLGAVGFAWLSWRTRRRPTN
jgi:apolipoprotein N-acyltransferase